MPKPLNHITSLKHLIELKLEVAQGSSGKGGDDDARFAGGVTDVQADVVLLAVDVEGAVGVDLELRRPGVTGDTEILFDLIQRLTGDAAAVSAALPGLQWTDHITGDEDSRFMLLNSLRVATSRPVSG